MNKRSSGMDISIIIVNYNSGNLLSECIQSIIQNIKALDYEIIIVDNMSTDSSFSLCEKYDSSHIKLIQAGANLGFSRANNLGASRAKGRVLHFLNPDTRIGPSLEQDYKVIMDDYSKGLHFVYVNPLEDRDGKIYYGRYPLPGTLNHIRYHVNQKRTKWYYIGASIIMSTVDFEGIGKWNELFYMYGEDADLFCRINALKLKIVEMPSLIYHYGGGSSENTYTNLQREILIQKSLRTYRKSNGMGWVDFWAWQILVVLIFWKRPKRLWLQVKTIMLSFKS